MPIHIIHKMDYGQNLTLKSKKNGRLHCHVKYIKWQVTPSRQDMAGYTLMGRIWQAAQSIMQSILNGRLHPHSRIWQVTPSRQSMAYGRLHTHGYSNITGTTSQASEIMKYLVASDASNSHNE